MIGRSQEELSSDVYYINEDIRNKNEKLDICFCRNGILLPECDW